MKILAITGSPFQGNTLEKVENLERKLVKFKDVEFETIHLKDMDLKPCLGCFQCFIKGDDKCPLKDDKEKIFQKLEEAEGVILATPVYSMHVSYLLKLFIDRFSCTFHRPRYFGKYVMTVAVAGNIGLKETHNYLKMVAETWGFEFVDELSYRAAPKNTPMKIPPLKKDRTDRVVDKFYTAIKEKKPKKLTLSDYLTFRLMQSVYKRLEHMSPFDYQYWQEKGWFDKGTRYFCGNIRGNIFKDVLARAMGWIMGRQMDKTFSKGSAINSVSITPGRSPS
jgi:multimeric flavodoxin WrbA